MDRSYRETQNRVAKRLLMHPKERRKRRRLWDVVGLNVGPRFNRLAFFFNLFQQVCEEVLGRRVWVKSKGLFLEPPSV